MQWADWLPDVLPHAPGCPDIVAEHELLRAAQDFFTRTRLWRVDVPELTVGAGSGTLAVTAPDQTELVRVESVAADGDVLPPATIETLEFEGGHDWRECTGAPRLYTQIAPGTLIFFPTPTQDAVITLRLALKPSDGAPGIDDSVADRAREAVVAGAKGRLMLYPQAPWANVGIATALMAQFDALCATANVDAARGFGRARIRSHASWC